MQNEGEANAPPTSTPREGGERREATIGELWGIIVCAAAYGAWHSVSGVFLFFFPEVIEGTWYYPFAYWTVVAGPLIAGTIWLVWTRWKRIL